MCLGIDLELEVLCVWEPDEGTGKTVGGGGKEEVRTRCARVAYPRLSVCLRLGSGRHHGVLGIDLYSSLFYL